VVAFGAVGVDGSICGERTCKICDKVIHGLQLSRDRAISIESFCKNLFKIENCCNRFLTSLNLLGPVSKGATRTGQVTSDTEPQIFWITGGIIFGVSLVCGIIAILMYKNGNVDTTQLLSNLSMEQGNR